MKRKQPKRQAPERLQPVTPPAVGDPKSFIRKEFEYFRKVRNKAENNKKIDPAQFDCEPAFEKRRTQALLNSLNAVEKYGLTYDWIVFNVANVGYASLEQESHILLGSAIWILDRIEETDYDRRDLYRLLPTDDDRIYDYAACVDVWDCSFEPDLISSVEYVLHARNEDIAPLENDGMNGHRVLTSKLAAEGKAQGDVPSRLRFERLLSMIPQAKKDLAVKHFTEYFERWVECFFACVQPLDEECTKVRDKLNEVGRQINEVENELERLVKQRDKMWQTTPKKTGKPPLAVAVNRNIEDMMKSSPMFGGTSQELEADSINSRLDIQLDKLAVLEEKYNRQIENLNKAERKKGRFIFSLGSHSDMSTDDFRKMYGDAVADAVIPLPVADPFEMCFAMLYLIEQDSDLPWLYGACYGVMFEVAEALPWGIYEYDEMEDNIWDEHPPAVSKPSDIPDWYRREYSCKGDDFPRSLAQILYEETGCLMPRDMHKYDSRLKELGKYGIRQNKAIAMLYCMLALGNARRSTRALNFESDYMERIDKGFEWKEQENAPKTKEQIEIQRLRSELHKAEKAARDADKRLAEYRAKSESERQELADLREIVFKLDTDEQEDRFEITIQLPSEIQHDTVIFGGHETWVKAIKPMLKGSVRFVSKDLVMFDLSLIRNADVVWVQSNAIPHTAYYRIVDTARKYNKPIRYFTFASAAKCAEQVAEYDMKLN